jgi:hypothetical protein
VVTSTTRVLRWIAIVGTGVTLGATAAHVLELPNKLTLDGHLWLAVQQHLYRGWGPFVAPFEVGAMVSSWVLVFLLRGRRGVFGPTLLAALCLSAALLVFFTLNAPVNAAFARWTPDTLPSDWSWYRLRWEIGHATSFVLVLSAFVALLRATFVNATMRRISRRVRSTSLARSVA